MMVDEFCGVSNPPSKLPCPVARIALSHVNRCISNICVNICVLQPFILA